MLRRPIALAFAAACCVAVMSFVASPALAQDILIVRPLNNSEAIVMQEEIVFEVDISSFATVVDVRINGESQPIDPSPKVNVRKQVRLERGFNTFVVEVSTEFETATKEFEIRFGRPTEEELLEHFQMATILGMESVSNPLKISDPGSEVSDTRTFVVLVPQYDWFPSKSDILRLQMVISRDDYGAEELSAEEVAFTQLTFRWLIGIDKHSYLSFGTGYNLIYSQFDSYLQGKARQAYDNLFFTDLHINIGEGVSFLDLGLEIKQQQFVDEPIAGKENEDEDAEITTLRMRLVTPLWGFRHNMKFSYATFDTEGELKRKTQFKISDDLTKTYGPFILGFGLRIKQNDFDQPDPLFDNVTPSERLVTLAGNATWPIFKSWILIVEAITESQASNVSESEYGNDKITLSTVFIF